jgi:hypothetical protein
VREDWKGMREEVVSKVVLSKGKGRKQEGLVRVERGVEMRREGKGCTPSFWKSLVRKTRSPTASRRSIEISGGFGEQMAYSISARNRLRLSPVASMEGKEGPQ